MSSTTIESVITATQDLTLNSVASQLVIKKGEEVTFEEYIQNPRFANIIHKRFVPTYNSNEQHEALEEFEHKDRGLNADPSLSSLLPKKANSDEYLDSIKVTHLTPKFGTEIDGIQLSELSHKGRDELALFIAQRGVAIFRNQDLKEKSFDELEEFSRYFGRPHMHPTIATAFNKPEILLIYHECSSMKAQQGGRYNESNFHSDVSYEKQPPGTTFLAYLQGPKVGGDTRFSDTVQAYERLSPAYKKLLDGLTALHTSEIQADLAKKSGGITRRAAVTNEHPVVRIHPVTKQKSLFVNNQFTKCIVGFKKEESDNLLNFLYDQINNAGDIQIRARYEEGTVVIWDNRRTVHASTLDWEDETDITRHGFRLTSQAEVPIGKLE